MTLQISLLLSEFLTSRAAASQFGYVLLYGQNIIYMFLKDQLNDTSDIIIIKLILNEPRSGESA